MLPLEKLITLENHDGTHVKFDLNYLVHFCVDLDLLYIDCDFPNNPKSICINCVKNLKLFYAFKDSCRSNNENYFMCETIEEVHDVHETQQLDIADVSEVKAEDEVHKLGAIVYDEFEVECVEDQQELETLNSSVTSAKSTVSAKKHLENSKNAERQKMKRHSETPEQKAERRRKAAEQTRLRRERMRLENPEKYADVLKRVADRKRERRKEMDDERKQQLRLKESIAARQRRSQLTEDKKEVYKIRNRESARARRSSRRNYDTVEGIQDDESCASSQEIFYIEEEQV